MQTIKLNLIPGGVLPVVNVSQYDVGRHFAIQIYEGSASYDLAGKSVQIRGTKPDGNGFAYDSTDGVISVSGSTVTVSTVQQMTAVGGDTTVELRITASGVVLGTLNFVLMVEPSALSDDTPISDTDIPAIERDMQAALDEAEADALKAEGHAQGTQDGTPVGSGSPYYQNNAKYYKEQADTDATNAGNSATSAAADALKSEGYAVGKQNGTAVQSGSPYYQNNAQYFDTHASEQAYNASQSANSASGSATAANTDALKSEGFAVGEQNGTPVSSGSPYYHNNAEYYRDQAAQYAAGGLHFMASVAFANIPTTGMVNGDMYNITDSFTTDARFVEGAGVSVSAGTNIAWVDSVSKWDILAPGGGSGSLSGLSDVTITSATSGEVLEYDGSKWVNAPAPSSVPAGGTTNQVLAKNSNTDGDTKWMDVPSVAEVEAIRDNGAVNFLPTPYAMSSKVENNVTFVLNSDGTVTVSTSGAATAETAFTFHNRVASPYKLPTGNYKVTGGISAGVWIYVNCTRGGTSTTLASDTGSGATFTAYDTDDMGTTLYVAQGTSIPTPITVKPMISPAALDLSIDDYQPYAMTNRELTEANSNLITGKLASVTFTNGSASVSIPAVKTTSRIIVTRNSGGAIHQVLTGNCSTNGTLKIGAYDVANAADFSGELSNITYLIDNR